MKDWQSQAHMKWECKYHVVILPKYRRKELYGRTRRAIGKILRELCRQKDVELVEGKAMPDHIHMLLSVPPKYSIAMTMGWHYLRSHYWSNRLYPTWEDLRQAAVAAWRAPCLVPQLIKSACADTTLRAN